MIKTHSKTLAKIKNTCNRKSSNVMISQMTKQDTTYRAIITPKKQVLSVKNILANAFK
tara:strand:- start:678 stop:851 length:174 start_codon:yes stop_codon:yes gene_type:complete